ncbi:hypothetical protein KM924_19855 [Brevibacillus parabrevis]|nr:hypothetical protein [Brevibacillus parabrevis]
MVRLRWRYRKRLRKRYGRLIWKVKSRKGRKGYFKSTVYRHHRKNYRSLVANEYIAAHLAKSLGVPVAKVMQAHVRGPNGRIKRGIISIKGKGSKVIHWKKVKKKWLKKTHKHIKGAKKLARLVAFDAWILNPDRSNRNLILHKKKSWKKYKWYGIDHGISLFGNPTKWNLRRARKKFSCKKAYKFCLHSGEKKKQRIPKGLKRFTRDNRKQLEKMVKKIQSLPKGKLKKAIRRVPKGLLTRAEKRFIEKVLLCRRKHLKKALKRISKHFG